MKKRTLFVAMLFISLNCMNSQRNRDFGILIDAAPPGTTNACGILNTTVLSFNWVDGIIKCYPARSNAEILTSDPLEHEKMERFVFEPIVFLESVNRNRNKLQIILGTKAPTINEVHRFLVNKGKRNLTIGNVDPICFQGVSLEDGVRNASYSEAFTAGGTLDGFSAILNYPDEETAKIAEEMLKKGGGITMYVAYNQADVQSMGRSLSSKDIYSSKAYRDMVSPVKEQGLLISVNKEALMKEKLARELRVYGFSSAEAKKNMGHYFDDFLQQAKIQFKDYEVSWDEIIRGASSARRLEDFESLRYKADEIKKLFTDANSLNDQEWCKKWALDTSEKEHKIRSRKFEGKAKLDVIKIVTVGGKIKYDRSTDDLKHNTYKEETSDCGRSKIQNAEKLEWEGHVITPKGIIARELINTNVNLSSNETIKFSWLTNAVRPGNSKIIRLEKQ